MDGFSTVWPSGKGGQTLQPRVGEEEESMSEAFQQLILSAFVVSLFVVHR